MKHRKLLTVAGAALLALGTTFTALAGVWKQDNIGWWYREDNGSYPVNTWKWIDGNNDGIAECYYFDSIGYLVTSTTTPDGYQVNENGAWVTGSDVQTQRTEFYVETSGFYTYKEMQRDLIRLQNHFPEVPIVVESLAQTIDEREVYHIVVGEESASKHILITGAIHAREYITAQLVMKQLLDVCHRYPEYVQMNHSVAFHFAPMINPDGVTISQLGLDGINREDTKQMVLQISQSDSAVNLGEYFTQWKANAQGEVIYWYFGQSGTLLEENRKLADLGSRCTGYKTIEYDALQDGLGYKDWAIQKHGIPSLTIEIGRGKNPVPHEQLAGIWEQNKNLIAMLLQEFLKKE